jgi:hypothetical protein
MNSDASVTAAYRLKAFTIIPTAGANGSITPGGAVNVDYGGSQLFNFTAASGYQVSDVQVDGVSVGPVTSYLFGNVMSDHVLAASFAAVPAPPPAPFILAFSAGEVEYVGSGGVRYLPDRYSTGGTTRSSDAAIKKTRDAALYQRERVGTFSYAIPLANGDYELTLKFAELSWNSRGKRVFDVYVEGKPVLKKLDLYAVAGNNTAYDVSILVKVEDGLLNLDFIPVVDQATVSAILIRTLTDSGKAPSSPARLKRYFSTQPLHR